MNHLQDRVKVLGKKLDELSECSRLIDSIKKETASYKQQMSDCINGGTYSVLFNELFKTVNMYETEKYSKEKAIRQNEWMESQLAEIVKENVILKMNNDRLMRELQYDAAEFETFQNNKDDDCGNCINDCPCKALDGKTILYVGGKSTVVSQCRKIVEKNGGVFIYHDGGRDNKISLLSKAVSMADTVFCPLGYMSQNASRVIKKICKRNQKKLIQLRDSGIASFSRGINEHYKVMSENHQDSVN